MATHVEAWLSPFWSAPLRDAWRLALRNLLWDLRPTADESWSRKLSRTTRALLAARRTRSVHDAALGDDALLLSPTDRWGTRPGPPARELPSRKSPQ